VGLSPEFFFFTALAKKYQLNNPYSSLSFMDDRGLESKKEKGAQSVIFLLL